VRSSVALRPRRLRRTAAAVAARSTCSPRSRRWAADRGYSAPEFNSTGELLIIGGRHPVIEELLRQKGERFVPNDLCFEPAAAASSYYGPNMAASRRIFVSPR